MHITPAPTGWAGASRYRDAAHGGDDDEDLHALHGELRSLLRRSTRVTVTGTAGVPRVGRDDRSPGA
jgi:hypothetical protein